MSEWISVKDALPPPNADRVLVALDWYGRRVCGERDTDRIGIHGEWVRWGRSVTHWMPLPEPPKEGDKCG